MTTAARCMVDIARPPESAQSLRVEGEALTADGSLVLTPSLPFTTLWTITHASSGRRIVSNLCRACCLTLADGIAALGDWTRNETQLRYDTGLRRDIASFQRMAAAMQYTCPECAAGANEQWTFEAPA